MHGPCFDYNRKFQKDFDADRLVAVAKLLQVSYRVAHEHCLELDPMLSRTHRHLERRVRIEQTLRDNAGRIDGVQAKLLSTRSGFGYVALYCGQSVLSACYVRRPGTVPRVARYRQQLARESQGQFDGLADDASIPDDASLYGILLHTPSREFPGQIGHLHLGFPHHEENRYLGDPTNLLMTFRPLYDLLRPRWDESGVEWRQNDVTGSDEDN